MDRTVVQPSARHTRPCGEIFGVLLLCGVPNCTRPLLTATVLLSSRGPWERPLRGRSSTGRTLIANHRGKRVPPTVDVPSSRRSILLWRGWVAYDPLLGMEGGNGAMAGEGQGTTRMLQSRVDRR